MAGQRTVNAWLRQVGPIPTLSNLMHKEEIAYSKGYTVTPEGVPIGPRGPRKTSRSGKWGRLRFAIKISDKLKNIEVHRLQAYQKFGEKLYEPNTEVRHKNNNYLDNSFDNLLLGTHQQNVLDLPPEERLRKAKIAANERKSLSDDEVKQLRQDRKYMTYKELMAKYGIAKSTVSFIVNRKTYADIK